MDTTPTDGEKTPDAANVPQQQNTTNVNEVQPEPITVDTPQPQVSTTPNPVHNYSFGQNNKHLQIALAYIGVCIVVVFVLFELGFITPATFGYYFDDQSSGFSDKPLGDVDVIPRSENTTNVIVDKDLKLSQIVNGDNFSCGIGPDNNAYCKGENKYGQLGNGTETSSTEIVAVYTAGVLSGKTIKSISAGHAYACAIASDDQAYCWGANGSGNLGNNSNWGTPYPVAVYTGGVLKGKTIKQISAGSGHTCAIASDNQAYCWGYNSYDGRLGNNSEIESNVPVAVDTSGVLSGKTIKIISVGMFNTCAIASDDQAYCWGDGYYGLLGNNTLTFSHVPVAVYKDGALKGKTVKSIETYPFGELNTGHVCVIASDDNRYCWGHDEDGAEKLGQYRYNAVPVIDN